MPSATSKYQALARNVENVLNHRRSLDAFRQWMLDEPGGGHAPQALDLYFAIKSYKDSVENRNPQAKLIARQLHIKFISLKTGCCNFLPLDVRNESSTRVHALAHASSVMPDANLFDLVLPAVVDHLRAEHALFVWSPHFRALFERSYNCEPSTSASGQSSSGVSHGKCLYQSDEQAAASLFEASFPYDRSQSEITTSNPIISVPSSSSGKERRKSSSKQNHAKLLCDRFKTSRDMKYHERPEDRAANFRQVHAKLIAIGTGVVSAKKALGEMAFAEGASDDDNRCIDKYEANMGDEDDDLDLFAGSDDDERQKRKKEQINKLNKFNAGDPSNPYGDHGFSLPPAQRLQKYPFRCPEGTTKTRLLRYGTLSGNEFSDSSGIGSMASAASRAAAAQEMTAVRYKMECEQTLRYPVNAYQLSIGAIQDHSRSSSTSLNKQEMMNVSYVDKGNRGEKCVCSLDRQAITFKQFRRCFCISSKCRKRFAFKSPCDDRSAMFQWTFVNDDDALLPTFNGDIIAECHNISDSE